MSRKPIGVFDSGVGGLTLVKELIKRLPNEDIVYFGDTARVPYGTKSRQTIIRFSIENILFLLRYNVKLIIVACNTSSSVALPALKKSFNLPIMGVIEPGATDALAASSKRKIGVIGTSTTIGSRAYEREIRRKSASLNKGSSKKVKIFSQSCPLFVSLAEEGWFNDKITLQIIRRYLSPLKEKGIDTLILGCTHYPLLKKSISRAIGKEIKLIDSAVSTAAWAERFMVDKGLMNKRSYHSRRRFFVTDEPERFKMVGEKFLGRRLASVRKVSYGL